MDKKAQTGGEIPGQNNWDQNGYKGPGYKGKDLGNKNNTNRSPNRLYGQKGSPGNQYITRAEFGTNRSQEDLGNTYSNSGKSSGTPCPPMKGVQINKNQNNNNNYKSSKDKNNYNNFKGTNDNWDNPSKDNYSNTKGSKNKNTSTSKSSDKNNNSKGGELVKQNGSSGQFWLEMSNNYGNGNDWNSQYDKSLYDKSLNVQIPQNQSLNAYVPQNRSQWTEEPARNVNGAGNEENELVARSDDGGVMGTAQDQPRRHAIERVSKRKSGKQAQSSKIGELTKEASKYFVRKSENARRSDSNHTPRASARRSRRTRASANHTPRGSNRSNGRVRASVNRIEKRQSQGNGKDLAEFPGERLHHTVNNYHINNLNNIKNEVKDQPRESNSQREQTPAANRCNTMQAGMNSVVNGQNYNKNNTLLGTNQKGGGYCMTETVKANEIGKGYNNTQGQGYPGYNNNLNANSAANTAYGPIVPNYDNRENRPMSCSEYDEDVSMDRSAISNRAEAVTAFKRNNQSVQNMGDTEMLLSASSKGSEYPRRRSNKRSSENRRNEGNGSVVATRDERREAAKESKSRVRKTSFEQYAENSRIRMGLEGFQKAQQYSLQQGNFAPLTDQALGSKVSNQNPNPQVRRIDDIGLPPRLPNAPSLPNYRLSQEMGNNLVTHNRNSLQRSSTASVIPPLESDVQGLRQSFVAGARPPTDYCPACALITRGIPLRGTKHIPDCLLNGHDNNNRPTQNGNNNNNNQNQPSMRNSNARKVVDLPNQEAYNSPQKQPTAGKINFEQRGVQAKDNKGIARDLHWEFSAAKEDSHESLISSIQGCRDLVQDNGVKDLVYDHTPSPQRNQGYQGDKDSKNNKSDMRNPGKQIGLTIPQHSPGYQPDSSGGTGMRRTGRVDEPKVNGRDAQGARNQHANSKCPWNGNQPFVQNLGRTLNPENARQTQYAPATSTRNINTGGLLGHPIGGNQGRETPGCGYTGGTNYGSQNRGNEQGKGNGKQSPGSYPESNSSGKTRNPTSHPQNISANNTPGDFRTGNEENQQNNSNNLPGNNGNNNNPGVNYNNHNLGGVYNNNTPGGNYNNNTPGGNYNHNNNNPEGDYNGNNLGNYNNNNPGGNYGNYNNSNHNNLNNNHFNAQQQQYNNGYNNIPEQNHQKGSNNPAPVQQTGNGGAISKNTENKGIKGKSHQHGNYVTGNSGEARRKGQRSYTSEPYVAPAGDNSYESYGVVGDWNHGGSYQGNADSQENYGSSGYPIENGNNWGNYPGRQESDGQRRDNNNSNRDRDSNNDGNQNNRGNFRRDNSRNTKRANRRQNSRGRSRRGRRSERSDDSDETNRKHRRRRGSGPPSDSSSSSRDTHRRRGSRGSRRSGGTRGPRKSKLKLLEPDEMPMSMRELKNKYKIFVLDLLDADPWLTGLLEIVNEAGKSSTNSLEIVNLQVCEKAKKIKSKPKQALFLRVINRDIPLRPPQDYHEEEFEDVNFELQDALRTVTKKLCLTENKLLDCKFYYGSLYIDCLFGDIEPIKGHGVEKYNLAVPTFLTTGPTKKLSDDKRYQKYEAECLRRNHFYTSDSIKGWRDHRKYTDFNSHCTTSGNYIAINASKSAYIGRIKIKVEQNARGSFYLFLAKFEQELKHSIGYTTESRKRAAAAEVKKHNYDEALLLPDAVRTYITEIKARIARCQEVGIEEYSEDLTLVRQASTLYDREFQKVSSYRLLIASVDMHALSQVRHLQGLYDYLEELTVNPDVWKYRLNVIPNWLKEDVLQGDAFTGQKSSYAAIQNSRKRTMLDLIDGKSKNICADCFLDDRPYEHPPSSCVFSSEATRNHAARRKQQGHDRSGSESQGRGRKKKDKKDRRSTRKTSDAGGNLSAYDGNKNNNYKSGNNNYHNNNSNGRNNSNGNKNYHNNNNNRDGRNNSNGSNRFNRNSDGKSQEKRKGNYGKKNDEYKPLEPHEICGSKNHSTKMHQAAKTERNRACGALKVTHKQLAFGKCNVPGCKEDFCPKIGNRVDDVPEEALCIQFHANLQPKFDGQAKTWPDFGGGCRCKKDSLTYPRDVQPKTLICAIVNDENVSDTTGGGSDSDSSNSNSSAGSATESDNEDFDNRVAALDSSLGLNFPD